MFLGKLLKQRRFLGAADDQLAGFCRQLGKEIHLAAAQVAGCLDCGTLAGLAHNLGIGLHRVLTGAQHDGGISHGHGRFRQQRLRASWNSYKGRGKHLTRTSL